MFIYIIENDYYRINWDKTSWKKTLDITLFMLVKIPSQTIKSLWKYLAWIIVLYYPGRQGLFYVFKSANFNGYKYVKCVLPKAVFLQILSDWIMYE